MEIRYKDICIRNIEGKDYEQLSTWWSDGKVMAHAGFPHGLNISADKIRRDNKNNSDDTRRVLMIDYKDISIGEMNYKNLNDGVAEIGIKICDPNYQEKGLGRIILSMLINKLFEMNYTKIVLDTNLLNKRAQHVYELLGFKVVDIKYDYWINQIGEPQSVVFYELTKDNFIKYL